MCFLLDKLKDFILNGLRSCSLNTLLLLILYCNGLVGPLHGGRHIVPPLLSHLTNPQLSLAKKAF